MVHLTDLPTLILIKITSFLELQDLVRLGTANKALRTLVYNNPDVWTSSLFPIGDQSITDDFIRMFVPRIVRSYGICELGLVDLPLCWKGFFWIFDQFAHSVRRIHLATSDAVLADLAHHLSIFAGTLALLQYENKIPITFRQYALDEEHYRQTLVASQYMGHRTLSGLLSSTFQLDDPPFERLVQLSISSTDQKKKRNLSSSVDHEETIRQLYFLVSFLSGRTLDPPLKKRSRPDDDEKMPQISHAATQTNKHRRQGSYVSPSSSNSATPIHHVPQPITYYHRRTFT